MTTHALGEERRFKRLIRNQRRARELWGRLVGVGFERRCGHLYRLVPAKAFDEVMATLRKLSFHVESLPPIGKEPR